MIIVGPHSLGILVVTASFIGIVFTLQIVKEFLFLNASNFIGAILALAFIRELSPILTAVILTGRISSSFTAELATMKVTEQIDALFLLRVNPFVYLVLPRLIACLFMLPCLNIIFFYTSLCSSIIVCSIFYNIHPWTFLYSFFTAVSYVDFIKSSMKALVFSLIISIISCLWGLTTNGGSKKVGLVTTSSVVTSLLLVFIVDCILTYIIFNQTSSLIKSL
jgi:phospholipid/cholesterol/gamma-HCH transport system permease protein